MAEFTDRLPSEIIQSIAAFCPLVDLLSLSRTCRRLREICYSTTVVQECFFHSAGEPSTEDIPDRKTLLDMLNRTLES